MVGLLTVASTAWWLGNPFAVAWTTFPVPVSLRWIGVIGYGCAVAWLLWMFHSLGRNLTDTVVTRRDAYFVEHGPYRFVRNPMYTGVLLLGFTLGLALSTWLLPLGTTLVFILMAIRTRTEERFLVARFGDQYRDYMRRVGRVFPRVSSVK